MKSVQLNCAASGRPLELYHRDFENEYFIGIPLPTWRWSTNSRLVLEIKSIAICLKMLRSLKLNRLCFIQSQVSTVLISRLFSKSPVRPQGEGDSLTVCTQENGIRKIILNNPKKRNALSLDMLDSIKANLLHNLDNELRVIILSANGPVFSSGHDLKELSEDQGTEYHQQVFHRCTEVMTLIQDIPYPVIAQVNGLATAAGCQLVASCDIAVASEKSQFATPGVNIGLFCSTPGVALSRAVPRKVAMEMLLTGYPISSQDALKHGLLSKVVQEDSLEEEVNRIVAKICETSQPVVAMGKECFYSQVTQNRDEAYSQAEAVMVENLKLPDGKEGIKAFLQKRKPQWSHKSDCH